MNLRRILIYRAELLPPSETFIAGQTASLKRYAPWFAGLKLNKGGLVLDAERVVTLCEGDSFLDKVRRRAYLYFGISPRFHRRVRKIAPSLIHAHFALDGSMALTIQQMLNVPMVVTLHGYDVTSRDETIAQTAFGRAYLKRRSELWRRASLFLCVSEHIRQKALERGYPPEKLAVHRIGIDLPAAEPTAKRERMVLFVGRMVEKKGCIHLIRAMEEVEAKMPDAKLILLGDGPLRPELEKEAKTRLRNATFLGMQPQPEVREWMRKAQILAAPSIVARSGDAEGLPTVLCEAQAIGLPVVSFIGPGVNEAVVADETALLVRPTDEHALGEAILRLLGNDEMRARFGEAGQKRAAECFDIRTQTALLEDKYDEVLREDARRRG
jgi:glycosyltransferase involved in cell wall biosynthesis